MATEDLSTLHPNALLQQLEARALALQGQSKPIDEAQTEGSEEGSARWGEQYLAFSLLGYEFAFKAEYIQGVERLTEITPVPNVASWVAGVISLRGSIASVVDLRAFLGMETVASTSFTRLLSVQYNDLLICLIVDGVSDMVAIPTSAIITSTSTRPATIPPWVVPYAAGSALLGKRMLILLDATHLLFADKMQRYSVES